MKNSKENNKEVSSSSSYIGQSSENCIPRNDFTPCSAGTKVTLKGVISEEIEKAIVLSVDWRGETYCGTLTKRDVSNTWTTQRLVSYPQDPVNNKKHKLCKIPVKPVKKLKSSKKGSKKPESYLKRYPWSSVHKSNMVESKLRFGRDKRTPAYGSCLNSPKPSTSRTNVLNNSFSDFGSIATGSGLNKKTLFNFSKFSDPSKEKNATSLEQHGLQNAKLYAEEETQCNEVNSTKTSDNSLDEPDHQFDNVSVKEDSTISCLSRNDICLENYGGGEINCNLTVYAAEEDNDRRISDLIPVKPNFLYSNESEDTSSNASSHDIFNTSSSTKILEFDSELQNVDRSTLDQTAELDFICSTSKEAEMTTTELRLDDHDTACGKKYTALNNSDLADLELQSPCVTINNRVEYNEKGKFLYSIIGQKEMHTDVLKDGNLTTQPEVYWIKNRLRTSPGICKEVSIPVCKTLSYSSLKSKVLKSMQIEEIVD